MWSGAFYPPRAQRRGAKKEVLGNQTACPNLSELDKEGRRHLPAALSRATAGRAGASTMCRATATTGASTWRVRVSAGFARRTKHGRLGADVRSSMGFCVALV